jgi:hypothetical protein
VQSSPERSAALFVFQLRRLFLEFAGKVQQSARDIGVRRRVREATAALRLLAQEPGLRAYIIAVLGHAVVNARPTSGIPSQSRRAAPRDNSQGREACAITGAGERS